MRLPNRNESILLFFILVGSFIRLWALAFQNPNFDELWTLDWAKPSLSFVDIFITSLSSDYTPPLYYMAAHASMLIFGATLWAARLPSAIFGIMFIPVIYLVGKEFRDEFFGLILAGFSSIYYNGVFYSKYARSYSLDLLFFTAAFYFYMKLLKGDIKSAKWFALFAICSMWTHLYSSIPIGVMVLYMLYKHREKVLLPVASIFIFCLPLLNYVRLIWVEREASLVAYTFGATPMEIAFLTPLDIFAYSAFVIFPLLVWSLWKHRDEEIITLVSVISFITWISMFVLSLRTPIILHYSIFLVPMLLLAVILPFYEVIMLNKPKLYYGYLLMVILILEIVQVCALASVQRGSW